MKSAILVIDLQVGLFEEPGIPFDFAQTIARINEITRYGRSNGIPIIFVHHEQADGILQYNTPGWQLIPELTRDHADLTVRKTTPNSFLRTNLDELLGTMNISNLIICGYATEFCVDSTVRGAAALGYTIQLVSDAHTTHEKTHASAQFIRDHHNETLSNIKSFGVPIHSITTQCLLGSD